MKIHEIDARLYKKKLSTELDDWEKQLADLDADLQQARKEERTLRSDPHSDPAQIQPAQDKVYALVQKRKEMLDQMNQQLQTAPMPQAKKYMEEIEQECSEILAINRKLGLYLLSGMKDRGAAFAGHTTTGRKPSDSSSSMADLFDYYLQYMGFKALRNNSIFVTTDNYQAEGYGKLYLIFPKDNQFSYTYTNRKDLILDQDEQDNLQNLSAFISAYSPMAQQIDFAMKTGKEIYISGQYIALKADIYGKWVRERWGGDILWQHENLTQD